MLATWVEPVFLVAEAETLLHEAAAVQVGEIRWAHDRLEVVEPEAGSDAAPIRDHETVSELPRLDAKQLDEIHKELDRLHQVVAELAATEGEQQWRR